MSQADIGNITSGQTGPDFFDNKLEPWRDALHTLHSGTLRPSYAQAGLLWLDNSTTPWVLKMHDGTDDIALCNIDATTNLQTTIAEAVNAASSAGLVLAGSDGVAVATIGASGNGRISIDGGLTITKTSETVDPAATSGNVLSGTFTPTLTNATNITSSTASLMYFYRVGQMVTFFGQVSVTPASTGDTILRFSLPIAKNFTGRSQASGTAQQYSGTASTSASLYADTTNDTVSLRFVATSTSAIEFRVHASYVA